MIRPLDFNITVGARLMLNYSVQTILRDFLRASHAGSKSGPDIPKLLLIKIKELCKSLQKAIS